MASSLATFKKTMLGLRRTVESREQLHLVRVTSILAHLHHPATTALSRQAHAG